ncbi:MAG: tyrosine-type recombinase/integrase, partial [Candidatus Korobacteraceae bacterium]
MAKRTRYQYGSVEIDKRVTGPDVWLYRWWDTTSDGRKTRRGFTVGTVEEYKTQAQALKAAEGKRLLINDGIASRPPVLFGAVLDRFLLEQKQEQEAEQITHSTCSSYRSMISQHIRPKWGDVLLRDVRPALVQDWLRKLPISPKYKGHIRSLMYRLFDRAMIWELIGIDRNPMQLVEVKGISKRRQRPRTLQVKEAWRILDALSQPYRTIVLIALCFGLRISEILGLRWTDFDFKRSAVLIQRSSVGKRLNRLKTECSQDEVPLERGFIVELKKWQELCLESEGQWLFPSPVTGRPLHADSMRTDHLIPTSLLLGLGRIGFHTFRHTYRAWLDETGAPVGVQQKLMRHAHISTTMD